MLNLRMATVAAVFGALAAAPALAQNAAEMGCSDYNSMSQEEQLAAVVSMMETKMGAEGSEATNEEVRSMLLEKCEEFPDSQAMAQFDDLPLGVQQ